MSDEAIECPYCKRLDCSRGLGGRSESAYESCLHATRARATQAEEAVLRTGRDPRWAGMHAWCNDNKDELVKITSDACGRMERELINEKQRREAVERDLARALAEAL